MLTRTINCPVLLRTAVCSIAHSSGAVRLALVHRAFQPGCAAGAGSAWGAAGVAGVAAAAVGAAFDFWACWAWLTPIDPTVRMAMQIVVLMKIFTERAPGGIPSDVALHTQSQVTRRLA